jgi:hypothetical protein
MDSQEEQEEIEIDVPKVPKKKGRTMTPELKEKLKIAREKALQVKAKNKLITSMEKENKIKEKQIREDNVKAKHEELNKPKEEEEEEEEEEEQQ